MPVLARRRPGRKLMPALGLGFGLLAGLALLGWKASGDAVHPAATAQPWGLADHPGLRPVEGHIEGATGVRLATRYFPGENGAVVVLTHGYSGNQDELLPVADALHRAGFGVFTYDSRGSGDSGGEVTFGTLEQRDLRSVIDHVAALPGVDRIGAYGFSMGGATTVLEAAGDTRVQAVADDSGWGDVHHWLQPTIRKQLEHPGDRFTPLSLAFVRLRTQTDFGVLKPERVIGRLSPRPLLLLHGDADEVVAFAEAEHDLAAAGEPKELWRLPGGRHGDTLRTATAMRRIVAFFEQALRA